MERLIDRVHQICKDLSNKGWSNFFQKCWGFQINCDSPEELQQNLGRIHKRAANAPGFEDFAGGPTAKGVEPGSPCRSILYHALASPGVRPFDYDDERYPSIEQIDLVESYVFSSRRPSIADLRAQFPGCTLGIVPFALEYRQRSETPHRKHADLVFSRTAVMRIGNKPAHYSASRRSYLTFLTTDSAEDDVHVLPCRIAPFLAVQLKGCEKAFRPFRYRQDPDINDGDNADQVPDDALDFWIPVHKLFSGEECLRGISTPLDVRLKIHVENAKLRKFHQAMALLGHDSGHHEPEISGVPFLICNDFLSEPLGFSGTTRFTCLGKGAERCSLLMPESRGGVLEPRAQPLVRLVRDENDAVSTFEVPQDFDNTGSSLQIFPRPQYWAPEFVHVRFRRDVRGFTDLNSASKIDLIVEKGKYRAAHLRDFSGEGFINVECSQLLKAVQSNASAYFVFAQPDPLPRVKQSDLMEWWESLMPDVIKKNLWYDSPRPLCDDRFPANVHLKGSDFRTEDRTISAVVGFSTFVDLELEFGADTIDSRTTALPDDASGIFAPGWDVGIDRIHEQTTRSGENIKPFTHLAAYGLGSPFAEDSKLCAAQSAYWPAAAPDTARTYEPLGSPTVTPLTDEEMGWHPVDRPTLLCNPSKTDPGQIRYATRSYADYARALLPFEDLRILGIDPATVGKFNPRALEGISLNEYATRTVTMARVYLAIGAISDVSSADDAERTNLLAPGKDERSRWVVFKFDRYDQGLLLKSDRPAPEFVGYYFKMYKPVGQRPGLNKDFRSTIVYFNEMVEVIANPARALIFDRSVSEWKPAEKRKNRL